MISASHTLRRLAFCCLLLAFTCSLLAQRTGRRGPTLSPDIGSDGKVTFRFVAGEASEVSVRGQWPNGVSAMEKGEEDVWTAVVGPVEPGVWEYSIEVDGIRMIDPGNPWIKPMRQPRTSILHIPGDPLNLHDFRSVPHGTVRFHDHHSKSLNRLRHIAVYTPPGYDQNSATTYPTLYLQHGSGDNHGTWTVHGKAHWIMDNLIAEGGAKPMVIVMMDGHAALDRENNTEAFTRDLLEDVLPFVESNYRVSRQPSHRGIVGLSMGGGQSLTIGLNHSDVFSWVGGFSSSVPQEQNVTDALASADTTNQRLRLLWIACGQDDFLLQRNKDFIALLIEKKVQHEWLLTSGDHSWPVWRIYLADFLPRLFQGL